MNGRIQGYPLGKLTVSPTIIWLIQCFILNHFFVGVIYPVGKKYKVLNFYWTVLWLSRSLGHGKWKNDYVWKVTTGNGRHCLKGNYVLLETSHDFHFRWIFLGGRVSGWTRKNTHSPKWTRNIFQLDFFIFQLDFFHLPTWFFRVPRSLFRKHLLSSECTSQWKILLAWFSGRFFCNGIDDLVKQISWKPDLFEAPEFHGRRDFSSLTSPNFRSGWTPGRKRSGIQTRPGWWKNSWGGLFVPLDI